MELSAKEKIRLRHKYGPWAIVTGASSGIGRELADQLASAGIHLLITARSGEILRQQAADYSARYHIKSRVVVADAAAPGAEALIINAADGLPVGLLVLAAGFGTSGPLLNSRLETELNMLEVNCAAVLRLLHHYSCVFVQQKRGGIVLMSSIVAFQGVPNAAHYSATKAWVQTLAEGLAPELKSLGVDLLAAAPGPVDSGFARRAGMIMSMSLQPAAVAAPILRALGRRTTVFPGRLSKLLVFALRTVPRWGKVRIMGKVMEGMTRQQQIRKQ